MAQDWYYKLLGEETGPVTFAALREMAGDGYLASDDEVRTSTSHWTRAEHVPELFQADEVEEPELANGMDLDLLLAPSNSPPIRLSAKRLAQRDPRLAKLLDVSGLGDSSWLIQKMAELAQKSQLK